MTKTSLISLLGVACGLASFVLGATFSSPVVASRAVAWEQPPPCIPRPSGGVRVLSIEAGARPVAWEQPPNFVPRPGGGVRVLTAAATA